MSIEIAAPFAISLMTEGHPPELYRSPELDSDSMALLGEGTGTQWAPIPNLDQFFSKVGRRSNVNVFES